jgi:hypothetical protein
MVSRLSVEKLDTLLRRFDGSGIDTLRDKNRHALWVPLRRPDTADGSTRL